MLLVLTTKQPRHHTLCALIPGKQVLLQHARQSPSRNLPLKESQKVWIILLFAHRGHETRLVTQGLNNLVLSGKHRPLIAAISIIRSLDLLGRGAKRINA